MDLVWKAALGAVVVLVIAALARTPSYYVAGLAPLFPTFALLAHWIVGRARPVADLRETVAFGMFATLPYLGYLGAVYVLAGRWRLPAVLAAALAVWLALAAALVAAWPRR
jgi:uncharacterized membrane protein (GlpM family)